MSHISFRMEHSLISDMNFLFIYHCTILKESNKPKTLLYINIFSKYVRSVLCFLPLLYVWCLGFQHQLELQIVKHFIRCTVDYIVFYYKNYLHIPLELGEFCLFHKQRTAPNTITITVRAMAVITRGPKNAETGNVTDRL